ncbi:hypothetical protein IC006_0914 [Sulfuracidifex tepidarius]|uniref:Uncharacterized protein n=1 Tax=Sulfuracidifex tepidarius TaxID=1294262 RepID=A0A510DTS2_9CREN|nr:hypothetical protein [Sulfuracidifex tepidarius]BBG23626.1 hypothetical protein IC006_0914 [Sulfuracidifex tepidarius]
METKRLEKEIVFVSKVSVTKSKKNGKEYITYRVTVPMEKAKELELNDGDYLLSELTPPLRTGHPHLTMEISCFSEEPRSPFTHSGGSIERNRSLMHRVEEGLRRVPLHKRKFPQSRGY